MQRIPNVLAGALAYIGLYYFAAIVLVRLGVFHIAWFAPIAAGALIGASLSRARATSWLDAVLAVAAGGAVMFALGIRGLPGALALGIGAPSAFASATLLGWLPLARAGAVTGALLGNAIAIGFWFALTLLFVESEYIAQAAIFGIVGGIALGGFLAQLITPERRMFACGSSVLGIIALLLLFEVYSWFAILLLLTVAPGGLFGAWAAWQLRRNGGDGGEPM